MKNKFLIQVQKFRFYGILRLVLFVFTLIVNQVSINAQTPELKKNIKMTNVTVQELVDKLGVDFKYSFFIVDEQVGKVVVSVDIKNATIYQILDLAFKNKQISYTVIEKSITISAKKKQQNSNLSKKFSGLVTDIKGEPLIGANIKVKGMSTGTTTDVNGKFNLDVSPNSILQISYLGYVNKEVQLGLNPFLSIILEENTNMLADIVVIGYGTASRKDLTGSVATVSMNDVTKNPVASFQEALGGRIAGVQVTSLSGKPGENIDIVIRGGNSITQSNSPLYVIDGFTVDNGANLISPDDIEAMSILKDASATAIYGARGANGVILITTKKGSKGKPKVQYNAYYGVQKTNAKIEVLDPYNFVAFQLEMFPTSATENYLTLRNMTLDDYKNIPKVSWQDHLFRTAEIQSHYLSVSGQADKTNYSLSASYFDQSGVIITSGNKKYTARLNLEQYLSDVFKMGITGSFSSGTISGVDPDSQSSYVLESMWSTRPFLYSTENIYQLDSPKNTDPTDRIANPIANLIDTKISKTTTYLSGNTFLEYEVLKGLKLRMTGGISKFDLDNSTFYGSRTTSALFTAQGVQGKISNTSYSSFINENTLTYNKTIKKYHKLNLLGGITYSTSKNTGYSFGATNLPYESLELNGMEDGIASKVTATSSAWGLMSYLGRLTYSYKSKYLTTASFRYDGSSKFVGNNRWAFFPSGSVAWVVSEEPFMKASKKVINNLKVRTSWGRTGNNNVSDFASQGQLRSDGKIYPFGGSTNYPAMIMTAMDNYALKWETTEQFDVGCELSLFSNRIKLELDYYNKKTFDLLLNADLPYSSGFTTAYKNVGSIRNQGVEFTLNTINIKTKKFEWNSTFNISTNKNEVLALSDGQRSMTRSLTFFTNVPAYIAIVGQPLSLMYGYVSEGLYQESDFIKDNAGNYTIKSNIAVDRPNVKPGYVKFKDLNNDGKIDANDRTVIGNGNPLFTGGFNNNFNFMNFDLTLYFQWSYGNDILNGNKYAYTSVSKLNRNGSVDLLNRWTPTNTDTDIPVAYSQVSNQNYYSWMVEDGSYFRLKSLQLGYSFPSKLLKPLKISKFRIYSTLNNIWTLTKYSGFDPEVSTQFSNMTRGFDYSSYPRSLSAVFGVNVNF